MVTYIIHMKQKTPYDQVAAGKMGGRPLKSGKPRQRKSIAFLGEAVDTLEAIAESAEISFADVIHVALLRYSIEKELLNEEFLEALKGKAVSLESDALLQEITSSISNS